MLVIMADKEVEKEVEKELEEGGDESSDEMPLITGPILSSSPNRRKRFNKKGKSIL